MVDNYFFKEWVILGINFFVMCYVGFWEVIFYVLICKNYGCIYFIVGWDYVGVGDYYGIYDVQEIFDEFVLEVLGIVLMKFEYVFYCKKIL